MDGFNILLIIIEKCYDMDICVIYRCLNVSIFPNKTVIMGNRTKCKKTFEKNECQKIFDMNLYSCKMNKLRNI